VLDGFVDILCEHASHFCAFSYTATVKDRAFKDTYETALSRVMLNAGKVVDQEGDRIRLVFAKTHEISGEMIGRYFDLINWQETFVESYEIARSSGSPPLQAAEIVARGLKRQVQDGLITHSFARVLGSAKMLDWWVHR
jgi:hypothetical protein